MVAYLQSPNAATDASGYYINAEYDIRLGQDRLPVFIQHESYNTTEEVVSGTAPDNETDVTTVGINYFPHEQVVLKLDYAMKDYNDASQQDVDTLSFGLGFIF